MVWRGETPIGKQPKRALRGHKVMLRIWCKIERFTLADRLIERYT
jgi:hypothetical protein